MKLSFRIHLRCYDDGTEEGRQIPLGDFPILKYLHDSKIFIESMDIFDHIEWNHYLEIYPRSETTVAKLVILKELLNKDKFYEVSIHVC